MDYLIQYLESSGIAFCPYTPAETELFLFIWSRVFLNKKDTEALLESQGLFEQFGKYNPKQITGQSALEEFGEQIKPCQLFTTNSSIGILCQTIPPPQDLQKFCLENGRKPNAPACELIASADDFHWTLVVDTDQCAFASAQIEIDEEFIGGMVAEYLNRTNPSSD